MTTNANVSIRERLERQERFRREHSPTSHRDVLLRIYGVAMARASQSRDSGEAWRWKMPPAKLSGSR